MRQRRMKEGDHVIKVQRERDSWRQRKFKGGK